MPLSSMTAFPFIPEGSEATPGLWNNPLSIISQNIAELNIKAIGLSSGLVLNGSGDPNSNITAGVGFIYEQIDSTASVHPIWVKKIGSGNTGWASDAGFMGDAGDGQGAIQVGQNASAQALNTLALGASSFVGPNANQAIAAGFGSTVTGSAAIGIGAGTQAYAPNDIAIGVNAYVGFRDGAAFGSGATSNFTAAWAFGPSTQASGTSQFYFANGFPLIAKSTDSGGAVFNVKAFGATGDGVTDDTTAIQNTITAANISAGADGANATVYVPQGTYQISDQLVLPYGVSLRGAGARSSRIRCSSATQSGITTTGAIRLGSGAGAIFGTMVENLMLECSSITSSIGIYSSDVQDNCGLRHVCVNNFRGYGLRFDGSAGVFGSVNAFVLEHCEFYKANGGGSTGTGVSLENGTFPGTVLRNSVVANSANSLQAAYAAINFPLQMYQCSADGAGLTGVSLVTQGAGNIISGLVTNKYTTSVKISTVGRTTVEGLLRIGGTNSIVDDGNGSTATTITTTSIPLFTRGESSYVDGLVVNGTLSLNTYANATSVPDHSVGVVFRSSGLSIVYKSGSTVYVLATSSTSGTA